MPRLTRVKLAGFTGVALAALIALPGIAFAGSSGTIAQTGGMSATLPILGASLSVDITLDANGNLSQVNLDPVGTYTATGLSGHAVTFDTSDGVTRVKIRSSGDKLSIKASTATLDNLLGSGTWSADVFGTKAKSSVAYTIGKAGDGSPTVVVDSVNAAAGITATTVPAASKPKGGFASASAGVDFASGGFVKHLVIRVSVRTSGTRPASLSITLSGRDRHKLAGTLADLAGAHTWSGMLCGGTAVTATFNVAADGTVTFGSATGAPATGKTLTRLGDGMGIGRHEWFGKSGKGGSNAAKSTFVSGALASFTGSRTRVAAVVFKLADGSYVLAISSRGGECRGQQGTPPKVNTPVSSTATQAASGHGAVRLASARTGSRHGHGGRGRGGHGSGRH